jgi:hypothetical protein
VLIDVPLALIAATRADMTKVSTLLPMFSDGHAPNEDAKAILREIAEGVQHLTKTAGFGKSKSS